MFALLVRQLAKKLHTALGDKLFYLVAEAPVRDGKTYGGYLYQDLAAASDTLVLRVAPCVKPAAALSITPPAPPEEIYYALASLRGTLDPARTALTFSTEPLIYQNKKPYELAPEALELLMADESIVVSSSERYAASYFTAKTETGKSFSVWYVDESDVDTRLQLATLLGVSYVCIADDPAS